MHSWEHFNKRAAAQRETWNLLPELSPRIQQTTPVGFEPTRGDPIGLADRHLSRSAKVSCGGAKEQDISAVQTSSLAATTATLIGQGPWPWRFERQAVRGGRAQLTAVGFEPTQLALVELESTPLDHSGKLSWRQLTRRNLADGNA